VDLLTTSVATGDSDGGPYTLVALAGEADVTNSGALRELLDAEVAKEPRTLVIDLSELRFMDARAACSRWPDRVTRWRRCSG
jgi:anti-anti-sigma regulatory factor